MVVDDLVRKCVAFAAVRLTSGEFKFVGSVFFLGDHTKGTSGASNAFMVTARHVLQMVQEKTALQHLWIRLNQVGGSSKWVCTKLSEWHIHPSDVTIDVAVLRVSLSATDDHLVYPTSGGVTQTILADNYVGCGDEVFITGLFSQHTGSARNIPVVRIGNIAALGEETVATKMGSMRAYLIEARSTGGLSGAPVFLALGHTRVFDNVVKTNAAQPQFLLGLVHGHYDDIQPSQDSDNESMDSFHGLSKERINMGIAMVVPFEDIESVMRDAIKKNDIKILFTSSTVPTKIGH